MSYLDDPLYAEIQLMNAKAHLFQTIWLTIFFTVVCIVALYLWKKKFIDGVSHQKRHERKPHDTQKKTKRS